MLERQRFLATSLPVIVLIIIMRMLLHMRNLSLRKAPLLLSVDVGNPRRRCDDMIFSCPTLYLVELLIQSHDYFVDHPYCLTYCPTAIFSFYSSFDYVLCTSLQSGLWRDHNI
ncbi:hypothetical protein M758_8G054200 [Ceratodon purpureus]|nr:hypothetical protein M758_8G054200 [Ceratodon purpureus]